MNDQGYGEIDVTLQQIEARLAEIPEDAQERAILIIERFRSLRLKLLSALISAAYGLGCRGDVPGPPRDQAEKFVLQAQEEGKIGLMSRGDHRHFRREPEEVELESLIDDEDRYNLVTVRLLNCIEGQVFSLEKKVRHFGSLYSRLGQQRR